MSPAASKPTLTITLCASPDPDYAPESHRRFLREGVELLRKDLAAGTGIATETVRNLETGRHAATPWTWSRLLSHPALQDLPRLVAEAGLTLPAGAVAPMGGSTSAPLRGGTGCTPAATQVAWGEGEGERRGGASVEESEDGDGSGDRSAGSGPGRRDR